MCKCQSIGEDGCYFWERLKPELMSRTPGTGIYDITFSSAVLNCMATWLQRDLTEMSKNLVLTEGKTSSVYGWMQDLQHDFAAGWITHWYMQRQDAEEKKRESVIKSHVTSRGNKLKR